MLKKAAGAPHRGPKSLQELCDVINGMPPENPAWNGAGGEYTESPTAYFERHGLLYRNENDLTSLPTFGGTEPKDLCYVWSWDETHLLVGECLPWRIVPRRVGDD
jgi:hypothetical protein